MATTEPSRARRFALPALHDERTEEAIEAFLEGPKVRRARRGPRARSAEIDARPVAIHTAVVTRVPRPSSDLRAIPGRLEFSSALDRECARAARYGRPAAVAIVELLPEDPEESLEPWLRRTAGPLVRVLRDGSRTTDLVARVAAGRFHVLLPETTGASAEHYVERMAADCRAAMEAAGAPVAIRMTVAASGHDQSLHDALADALRSIEAA